jgi:guanylate kinase
VHIVVSGPGGVGKGTMVSRLLARDPAIWLSRSWTTRARRPGEPEDAYVFTDRGTFEAAVAEGRFLEWVAFLDYLQGTPIPPASPDKDVLFEIDVHGARSIAAHDPDALLVFVDTPSRADQEARLRARGDSDERVAARLAKGDEERRVAAELGMITLVNDDLDRAVDELAQLIAQRRSRGPSGPPPAP